MTRAHVSPSTGRLTFERFGAAEVEGLAALLSDREITRNITANGATAARCAAAVRARIA